LIAAGDDLNEGVITQEEYEAIQVEVTAVVVESLGEDEVAPSDVQSVVEAVAEIATTV
jgi:hypothetical protein